ncbi:MAG: hypothetical protein K6T63_14425 [Alicyclobacillus herbarius]|uniref:hypothetical protein n=1 Tax=Alicyclobacillus herbarius TaxID=122960 RepID=UPI0023558AD7|nr:hypothetical protein [Alicyclobacillus herbarius]MCL6633814.1 hypothetical protein [Alicyclobacillus herbarius]
MGHALVDLTQLHSAELLRFRLRKLTIEVANRIADRTQMFSPERNSENFSEVMERFPMFLVAYLAVAWSMYLASASPADEAQLYSSKYLDLHVGQDSFLNVLAGHIIERNLLPDYRLGFLVGLLTACHMTEQADAQRRLWHEFMSQLSNLFASVSVYTELGMDIFKEFVNNPRNSDRTAE